MKAGTRSNKKIKNKEKDLMSVLKNMKAEETNI
jgi:hypothetical protein